MTVNDKHGRVSDEERRQFLKALGIGGAVAATGFTLDELRDVVSEESSDELAKRGEAIRESLTDGLDAELLVTEAAALADRIERVPKLGVPDDPGASMYKHLTEPGWRIDNHLANVGFFATAEANLPAFTPEHISSTTRELIRTGSLTTSLSDVSFDERRQTELVVDVVANSEQLAHWVPTWFYENAELNDDEPVQPENVPPLHRRAAAGALLWIDGLDWHLWQNEVLLTDQIVADAIRDVRAMLGGYYLFASAAEQLARGEITDEELTALITGSTAILIASQNDLAADAIYITDAMRASAGGV